MTTAVKRPRKPAPTSIPDPATIRVAPYVCLTEDLRAAPTRVDREAGVIRGVKILGLESINGVDGMPGIKRRIYQAEALRKAVAVYEGAKVNIDHPAKPGQPRITADGFGRLVNVRVEADGLRGDLEYLKSHPLAERICEAAERMPEQFGLSPHHAVKGQRQGDAYVIEEIVSVASVDIVRDPATTNGLFEQREATVATVQEQDPAVEPVEPAAEPTEAPKGAPTIQEIHDAVMALKDSLDPGMVKDEFMTALDEIASKLQELGATGSEPTEEEPAEEGRKPAKPPKGARTVTEATARENRALRLCLEAGLRLTPAKLKAVTLLSEEADVKAFIADEQATRTPAKPPALETKTPKSAARTVTESADVKKFSDRASYRAAILG